MYRSTILFAHLDQQGILGDVSADEADTDAAAAERASDARAPMNGQNPSPGRNAPHGDSSVQMLSVPLGASRTCDLRIPTNLSKEDFDFFLETLKLWERRIVAADPAR